jgi:hypothetical protein
LLYAGTDDGLIQVSENAGDTWRKVETFPGVPANTRVNMIVADLHDVNTVYAVFNNHRSGDFKPYILKSSDKGKTWKSISGDLPTRGAAFAIRQDHVNAKLLFAGTEFGCFFSNDAGTSWTKLGGLPTIAVYDIDIQKRENDVVVATFGRGFYVLDNYTPLRNLSPETLDKEAHLFPVKDALQYVPSSPLGLSGTGSQGADLWNAENPAFGATFSLYLKDVGSTLKSKRQKEEAKKEKDKEAVSYPTFDELREEDREDETKLIWIIRDAEGKEINRMMTSPKSGIQRVNWDLRMATTSPISLRKSSTGRYSSPDVGLMVVPGTYSVEVVSVKDGEIKNLIEKTNFKVVGLNNQTLLASNFDELVEFRADISESKRKIDGAGRLLNETSEKLKYYEAAIKNYPNTDLTLLKEIEALKNQLEDCEVMLWGDGLKSSNEFETEPSISGRIGTVYYQTFSNTTGITQTQRDNKKIAEEEYVAFRKKLDDAIIRLKAVEEKLSEVPVPYIKGKDENWNFSLIGEGVFLGAFFVTFK